MSKKKSIDFQCIKTVPKKITKYKQKITTYKEKIQKQAKKTYIWGKNNEKISKGEK